MVMLSSDGTEDIHRRLLGDADNGRRQKRRPHQRKLVRDSSVWGQFGSKAQGGKHLVTVIVLDDLPDGSQGHGVVVHLIRAHVMQRGGLGRVACDPNGENTHQHPRSRFRWVMSHSAIKGGEEWVDGGKDAHPESQLIFLHGTGGTSRPPRLKPQRL